MEQVVNNSEQYSPVLFNTGPRWFRVVLIPLALAGLWFLSVENYLFYHAIVEVLSVTVAATIFSVGWNSKQYVQDNALLVLAVAYLSVGTFDFLHLLSYKGMGVIYSLEANPATQLWIAARFLESIALISAAALVGSEKRLNPGWLLTGWVVASSLLLASIVPLQIFPDCYVEGVGLTSFKVAGEYVVSALLLLAGLFFWQRRHFLNPKTLFLLLASVVLTVLSELSFTLYADVYGLFNFVGHIFKLISIVLIYLALVQDSLKSPYETLFRKLSLELAQRKASEEKLQVANRELDAFVYTVSHDLRTPLTPIVGYADYLQEREVGIDDEARELLEKISTLGQGMSETMEDLLVLAQVGELERTRYPVPVDDIVEKVLVALGSRLHETAQTVKIDSLPDSRLPESQLRQVFTNLLGNALHYGQGAAIEVGGERIGDLVRFYVRDHGPGIPPAERKLVFDLFFRGSGANHTAGTGTGLAIVEKIARLYHGRAWAEETCGGGVTFCFEMVDPLSCDN